MDIIPKTIITIPAMIGAFKNTALESESGLNVTPKNSMHIIAVTAPEPLHIGDEIDSSIYRSPT